jgi:hypothetical protein
VQVAGEEVRRHGDQHRGFAAGGDIGADLVDACDPGRVGGDVGDQVVGQLGPELVDGDGELGSADLLGGEAGLEVSEGSGLIESAADSRLAVLSRSKVPSISKMCSAVTR